MKQLMLVLVLVTAVAGCSPQRAFRREPSSTSRYVDGYMDGYRSAYPDQPYTRDETAYVAPDSFQSRNQAYQQGWKAGYQTGREDLKQRQ